MPSSPSSNAGEKLGILVVELVLGESGAQRCGALLGKLLVEIGRLHFSRWSGHALVLFGVAVLSGTSGGSCRGRDDTCGCIHEHDVHGLFEIKIGGVDHGDFPALP